jgi:hypothetical protein
LDTTTVLLLDADPESFRFEDDAVVFSSPTRRIPPSVAAPDASTGTCFLCYGSGFYTT